MFSKVLISDDLGSINEGVTSVLNELNIKLFDKVQYCDDAYLKLKKAKIDSNPYDLIITDLSYIPDHREQRFSSGEELIKAIREEGFNLKIIVFSIEDKIQKVRALLEKYNINAYVCKSRYGLKDLKLAIEKVNNNETWVSNQVQQALSKKTTLEITDYDVNLLESLANGLSQEEISIQFKNKNLSPSSLSSIEKKLNKLKIQFKANNAIHLVSIVKDLGVI
ncbi:response regulator [Tenacibaculum geojense]|uniref:Response regulator n=1 Tax=Tenacibaculum geojense TaxID=915352 RepID=A0ABW3JTP9_9FLAO